MEGKEDVEDGGVVYKGWVARWGEAQGPVVVWPRDLFAVFSTRYLVTTRLVLFIFTFG